MKPKNVKVTEVTKDADSLICTHNPKEVILGNVLTDIQYNMLLAEIREQGGRVFILDWDGNKIPSNVVILGYEIIWTQNGQVTAKKIVPSKTRKKPDNMIGRDMNSLILANNLVTIGKYDRLEEWSGKKQRHHKMVIYLFPNIIPVETATS